MNTTIQKLQNDRWKGIWHLYFRTLPFHLIILVATFGISYGISELPFFKTILGNFKSLTSGFSSPQEIFMRLRLILIGITLFYILLYTLYTTLHYRINEIRGSNETTSLNAIFKGFFIRLLKGFVYNFILLIVFSGLLYSIVIIGQKGMLSEGINSVFLLSTALTLLILASLMYIRQLLVLPAIAHSNANVFKAIMLSFKKIRTKHALVFYFLYLATSAVVFLLITFLGGAIIGGKMQDVAFLLSNPFYKFIPLILIYMGFVIAFFVARSAMYLYALNSKNTPSKTEETNIIDHISEESEI